MSKLRTRLEYIRRCGYCNYEERSLLRDTNVNTNITDDNARSIAVQHLGECDSQYCENCKLITIYTKVAYDLPEEEPES